MPKGNRLLSQIRADGAELGIFRLVTGEQDNRRDRRSHAEESEQKATLRE